MKQSSSIMLNDTLIKVNMLFNGRYIVNIISGSITVGGFAIKK